MVLAEATWSSASAQQPGSGADARPAAAPVTFHKDVAPIVFAQCASCHRPSGVSFSLLTYEEVKARARLIAAVTKSRFMPPWRPEPGYGQFAGARHLSDRQIGVLQRWVDEGSREGDASEAPRVPTWTSEWRLGKPDLVLSMSEAYTLRSDGDDMYRNFIVPIPIAERRYIKAWEFRPGNSKVVHHATMHVDPTGASRRFDAQDPAPGYEGLVSFAARTPDGFFLDWAPGHTPAPAPAGMAWPVQAGSDLVMMLHMRPSGRPETVRASIGLYFSRDVPSRLPVMVRLNREDLDIPSGEKSYTVTDSYTVPVDVDVYSVQPHAHYLAREVRGFAKLPDGRTEPIIQIKDWAFDWQDVYQYDAPLFFPKGTSVVMEWRYDNSAENLRNPHRPPERVTYGQRTSDEMSELWLQVVPRNGSERSVLMRSIRAKVLPQEIKGFETMLRSEPNNVGLHDDAALLYAEMGNLEQSAAHFLESLRLRPESPAAHYNAGIAFLALGKQEPAVDYFRRALAIDPAYSRALIRLAWTLATSPNDRIRDPAEGLRLAERAAAASPADDVVVLDVLAAAYAAAGQFDRAVKTAETARDFAVTSKNTQFASEIQRRMALYRDRKPYREP
jgi:Flp pilus assembly protein TadD